MPMVSACRSYVGAARLALQGAALLFASAVPREITLNEGETGTVRIFEALVG